MMMVCCCQSSTEDPKYNIFRIFFTSVYSGCLSFLLAQSYRWVMDYRSINVSSYYTYTWRRAAKDSFMDTSLEFARICSWWLNPQSQRFILYEDLLSGSPFKLGCVELLGHPHLISFQVEVYCVHVQSLYSNNFAADSKFLVLNSSLATSSRMCGFVCLLLLCLIRF